MARLTDWIEDNTQSLTNRQRQLQGGHVNLEGT